MTSSSLGQVLEELELDSGMRVELERIDVTNATPDFCERADATRCAVDATRDTSVDGELADVREAPAPFAVLGLEVDEGAVRLDARHLPRDHESPVHFLVSRFREQLPDVLAATKKEARERQAATSSSSSSASFSSSSSATPKQAS